MSFVQKSKNVAYLLYNAHCPVCVNLALRVRNTSFQKIALVPIQSDEALRLLLTAKVVPPFPNNFIIIVRSGASLRAQIGHSAAKDLLALLGLYNFLEIAISYVCYRYRPRLSRTSILFAALQKIALLGVSALPFRTLVGRRATNERIMMQPGLRQLAQSLLVEEYVLDYSNAFLYEKFSKRGMEHNVSIPLVKRGQFAGSLFYLARAGAFTAHAFLYLRLNPPSLRMRYCQSGKMVEFDYL